MSKLLTAVLLVATLAGCGKGKPADDGGDKGAAKDTLVVAQGADAKSLDPHGSNDAPSSRVIKQIFENLVYQDANLEIKPYLAESWERVDDLTYRFKLKKGVKFHNGEELKASDVKFSIERAMSQPSSSHIVSAIDPAKIEVEDDYTIKIGTKEPFAPLLSHLAHPSASILNEKATTEAGKDFGQKPVGTGAFKFVNWATGSKIELTRFDEYHGQAPKYKNLTFRAITEGTNRTIELETGGVDIAYDILPQDAQKIKDNKNLVLNERVNLSTNYLGFNTKKAPFDNVKVRQAINYALDLESIVEAVLQGYGSVPTSSIAPDVWGFNKDLKGYKQDIDKAKQLMAEAGYADGFSATLWTNESQIRIDIATIVQNQLKQIGIEVKQEVIEWGAYLENTAAGQHDMYILGWTAVTGDADYGLYANFHSSQHGDAGNRVFYTNARVDELLDKAKATIDENERAKMYYEVQQIVNDEAPWVPVYHALYLDGTRANVKGFVQHPAGHHLLTEVYFE